MCTWCTVVDGLSKIFKSLTVEEVLKELLDLGDACGAPNKDNLVDLRLVHLRVLQALLHRVHALAEEVHAQLLEAGTCEGGGKVDALVQGVQLNGCLGC